MANNEGMDLKDYARAFYGDISNSQYVSKRKEIKDVSEVIASDIGAEMPDIESDLLRACVYKVLESLRALNARYPMSSYKSELGHRAFRYGMALARGKNLFIPVSGERDAPELEADADAEIRRTAAQVEALQESEADIAKRDARGQEIAEIWRVYQNLRKFHMDRVEDFKVAAYADLLTTDCCRDPEGYAWAFVFYFLPQEEGIYDEQGVIDATNAHPRRANSEPRGKSFQSRMAGWSSAGDSINM